MTKQRIEITAFRRRTAVYSNQPDASGCHALDASIAPPDQTTAFSVAYSVGSESQFIPDQATELAGAVKTLFKKTGSTDEGDCDDRRDLSFRLTLPGSLGRLRKRLRRISGRTS